MKILTLTRGEKRILDAMPICCHKTEAGPRIRSITGEIKRHFEKKGEKISTSMISRTTKHFVEEGILIPVESRKANGDKRPSMLYAFKPEALERLDIQIVPRKKGTRKAVKTGKDIRTAKSDRILEKLKCYATAFKEARKLLKTKQRSLKELRRQQKDLAKKLVAEEKAIREIEKSLASAAGFTGNK